MTHREHAEAINRAEWEAERTNLMRRAFAYAEQKRMADRARALGAGITDKVEAPRRKRHGREPKLLTYAGHAKTVREWSVLTGVKPAAIYARLTLGWTLEQTLCLPTAEQRREGITATPAADLDRLTIADHTPGVPSDREGKLGTGAGSSLQETPNITFHAKEETA